MTQPTRTQPVRTIGIDLGDRESSYCELDCMGELIEEGTVFNDPLALKKRFGVGVPGRIIVEASCQSGWISRCLEELGHEVVVANPRQVHMISKSDRKSDRNDARVLARLGRVDPELLRPVKQRSERSVAVRTLLGARAQLIGTRTRLVNLIRMETKVVGGRIPSLYAESFYRRAPQHIPEVLRTALTPLIEVLAELEKRIQGYDKEIVRLGKEEFPETLLFRQVGGVGPLVALAFAVTIEDPTRFERSRSLGAYLGLVPRSYQSGSSDPQLGISKRGDGMLRRLLVSSGSYILRKPSPDCDLKRHGERLARGGSSRDRGRARIAVARKLAVLLHRLWLTGEVYDPFYGAKRAA